MLIRQILRMISVKRFTSHGQRCIGISTPAEEMWRNHSRYAHDLFERGACENDVYQRAPLGLSVCLLWPCRRGGRSRARGPMGADAHGRRADDSQVNVLDAERR